MFRRKYFPRAWDVVILIIAILLGTVFILWAGRSAGDEPAMPRSPELSTVVSPWEGVFRAAPQMGDQALVEVGTRVSASTVVGFIDVDIMQPRRMIAVYAGVNGVVSQVLTTDGEFVRGGQPLMIIVVEPVSSTD